MSTGHIGWSPDFRAPATEIERLAAEKRKESDPATELIRELRDALRAAAEGGKAAADELMTEFISKTRAANWGVINKGLLACDAALRLVARATAYLRERGAERPEAGGEEKHGEA